MLSASRARYSRYPTTRLFYSTVQSVHGKVVNDLAPKPLDYKERGFRRAQVKRSQLAADAYDLHRHQDRRRRRKITRAFVTKTLEDEELLRRADRSAADSKPHWDWLVAVKDNISDSRFPTTCASKMLDGYISPYNAAVIESLIREKSSIVGKTNMDEFGMGSHSINSYFGPVRSGVDPTSMSGNSAGGSSGGSAVAVATKQCKMALGTDTGGSVRLPAAFTGTVGFKPSYGLLSRWGLIPYANSLDTIGFFGRLQDLEERLRKHNTFLKEVKKESNDNTDPTLLSRSSKRRLNYLVLEHTDQVSGIKGRRGRSYESIKLRIGVPVEYNTQELSQNVKYAWITLLETLQKAGHQIVPISLPSTKHALSAYYIIAAAEAASNLAKYDGIRYGHRSEDCDGVDGVLYAKTRGEGFGDEVQRRILLGSYTLSSQAIDNYFIQAQRIRRLVQKDFDRVFALPNGLREPDQIDLSDLDENISLEDKTGPAQVDLIICPTAPTSAPSLAEVKLQSRMATYMNDVFTVPASLVGLPAISIPITVLGQKPVGMQIIGQYFDDALVVGMARNIMGLLNEPVFSKPDVPKP